jgi:hypothetical protein
MAIRAANCSINPGISSAVASTIRAITRMIVNTNASGRGMPRRTKNRIGLVSKTAKMIAVSVSIRMSLISHTATTNTTTMSVIRTQRMIWLFCALTLVVINVSHSMALHDHLLEA